MVRSLSSRHSTCLVALWLLLLAALPVTAPFSTLDLAPFGPAPLLDSGKTKTSHDDMIAQPAARIVVPVADGGATRIARTPRQPHTRQAQRTVLRL